MTLEHTELTGTIIGCAMEVHRLMGPGFQEYVHSRALALEFKNKNLKFEAEYEMKNFYNGEYVALRKADFLVEKTIVLELKAVSLLEKVHLAQALNYPEASEYKVALLLNFRSNSLEFKRLHRKS